LVGNALELPHQRRDGVERRHVITWRAHASSGDLLTGGRKSDRFDLRSAEIDANAHGKRQRVPVRERW
jgi:hypothetical protein